MKSLLIGLIGLLAFNFSSGQIAIKTQLPGLVTLAARQMSNTVYNRHPIPPFVFLELEKGIGNKNSVLVYAAFRRGRWERPASSWGPIAWESNGYKLGLAYRRYLGKVGPMEGFYLQPTVQVWQGDIRGSNGDNRGWSKRNGGSFAVHGGYQLVIGPGFVADASLGFGVGTETVEGNMQDRISGYHRLKPVPNTGGWGYVADVRIGIGWMF